MMTKKEIARKERDERIILINTLDNARELLNLVSCEATLIEGVYQKKSEIITSLGNLAREVKGAEQ